MRQSDAWRVSDQPPRRIMKKRRNRGTTFGALATRGLVRTKSTRQAHQQHRTDERVTHQKRTTQR
jgi:hypothetical protein